MMTGVLNLPTPGDNSGDAGGRTAELSKLDQDAGVPESLAATGAPPSTVPAGSEPAVRVLSEATTVSRAQEGDSVAFTQLVRTYQAELFRLCFRMLGDRGEAQDLVQDTFILAWRKLPTLVDPEAFHGWIYQIATRACLQVLRTRSRRQTDLSDGTDAAFEVTSAEREASRGEGPAARAQVAAQLRGLDEVLTALPPEQRACWVLKELHGLSYPEISFAIGVPVSTVRGRIARARHEIIAGMASWR